MIGAGSLAHNRRDFVAENVDPDRVQLNICYNNENLKEVYKELFDDAAERYNVGKRKDRQIANYYEKIRQGKQEKLFHEVIFQIGNREDMAVGTSEGNLAVKILDEYVKDFQKRNPTLRVFSCYLHQDEATPHLHIDFVPYVTNWKGKGMDTRVSLKQALKSLGFQVLALLNLILFGIFESIYLLKTGNIWGISAIHSMWNFIQGNIYGFNVSGMAQSQSIFIFKISNCEIFSGGTFGLEGSLLTTIVLLSAINMVILYNTALQLQ